MLKKISLILWCFLFCSCSIWQRTPFYRPSYRYLPNQNSMEMVETTDYSQVDLGHEGSFRVAMLLPLSGADAGMGQSLKNAAMMAIGDINNNNLVVQFYDTKSTGSGARIALENALNADSELILGPLRSDEVAAISSETRAKNVPVISFSTSPSVLQSGVYSIGLMQDNQVERIVKYAVDNGRMRIAAVLPSNQNGANIYHSLLRAARKNGANLSKVGFYSPESMDFTGLVTQMKSGGVDFDALLIPETGNRLKAISSMFSYYDVAAPEVLFMGTSVWDGSSLSKETELYGAAYPVMSLKKQAKFAQKYNELFGEKPSGLSIFAYDAVALASVLSRNNGNIYEQIERPEGYNGMSGSFRVFANGLNEHGLDVVKVSSGGKYVAEYASEQFYAYPQAYESADADGYMMTPQIVGNAPAGL
ncbi:MAG: penicillin-binding protein activator [Alphaproteobacteria bacterium]|nr:penicillin-binding protein activator [Alphaproteobacteria bacterium]